MAPYPPSHRGLQPVEPFDGPLLPDAMIARDRLVDRMRSSAAITILRAPGGGGKTVALAQWAAAQGGERHPFAWVSVDVSTGERLAFWTAVAEAVLRSGAVPDGARLHGVVPALRATNDPARLLVRAFLELPGELSLVIDNAERIRDTEITDDLRTLLVACPRIFLVVAGHDVTELESPATASLLSTVIIDEDELAFTVEETAEALRREGFLDADARAIAGPLRESVAGFPLATRSVVASIRSMGGTDPAALADSLHDRASSTVSDFIAAQLAARADSPRLSDFLLRTSIAPELSTELATELSGVADAEELLAEAELAGLGMWELVEGERRFVYSSVIGSELRVQLAARFPAEWLRLKRIVAEWALAHGRFLPALEGAVEIRDYELASRVVRNSWATLLGNNPQAVIDVLSEVPLRAFRLNPLLAFCLALAYNLFDAHRLHALEMLGVAAVAARLRRPASGSAESVLLKTVEGIASRLLGRTDAARESAVSALDAYAELSSASRVGLDGLASTVLLHNGTSLLYAGQLDRALIVFQESYAAAGPEITAESIHARSMIAGTYALRGDLPEARALVEQIRSEEWPERWKESYMAAFYRLAETIIALESFAFDEARRQLDTLADHFDTIEHWPLLAALDGQIQLGRGDAAGGLAALDRWVAKWRRGPRWQLPLSRELLATTRSILQLSLGQTDDALRAVEHAPRSHPNAYAVPLARIALCQDDSNRAIDLLRVIDPEQESPRQAAERLVIAAAASLRLGSTGAALAELEDAAMLVQDRRLRVPVMLIPSADLTALAAIAEEHGLYAGAVALAARVPEVIGQSVSPTRLTSRELVVLQALVSTSSVQAIAAQTYVSKNTVKTQLRSVYRKLGVTSREDALRVAKDRALVKRAR
jgi:LuxR family maltose regulon positive regulatory protein